MIGYTEISRQDYRSLRQTGLMKMSLPYTTDVVPSLMPFFGDNTEARDVSCLIVQFTGYVITDWEYAKFRAQVMTLINDGMANGWGGVDVVQSRLSHSFIYNETHALWLMNDLHVWGYTTTPWFLVDGDTHCFMSVDWKLPARDPTADPRTFGWLPRPFCLALPTPPESDDEETDWS
jgi:hypothetical protein